MENYQGSPDQHYLAVLHALGSGTIAFRAKPLGADDGDSLVAAVHAAAAAVVALDGALAALNDPERPPVDVISARQGVSGAFVAAQVRIASLRSDISRATDALRVATDSFFGPAVVADMTTTLLDVEVRSLFAAASESERAELWKAMSEGTQDALLSALARAPFGAIRTRARVILKGLQEERAPERVAAFERETERLEWATGAVDQLDHALDRGSQFGHVGPRVAVADAEPAFKRALH